ncbi:hypothetical protein [Streptomyces lydicus]|uniref:hypothetical protein n=1 Tax=Streptomyces lydicus TaxID=47763 RepID=UPI0036FC4CB6
MLLTGGARLTGARRTGRSRENRDRPCGIDHSRTGRPGAAGPVTASPAGAPTGRADGFSRAPRAGNPQVAHDTGEAEPVHVTPQGRENGKSGDVGFAPAKSGRTSRLTERPGREEAAKLLAKVVDVADAAAGTVRLEARVAGRTG